MNDEIQVDEELQQLLDEIDVEPQPSEKEPKEEPKEETLAPNAVEVEVETGAAPLVIEDEPSNNVDFERLLAKFNITKEEIERSFADDRAKIQEVLDLLMEDKDGDGFGNAQLEAISSLISTKATIPANRIRLLDSYSKFIIATKNYNTGKPDGTAIGDLKDVLSSFDADAP